MRREIKRQPILPEPIKKNNFLIYALTGFLIIFILLSGYLAYADIKAQKEIGSLNKRINKLEGYIQQAKKIGSNKNHKPGLAGYDNPENWQVYRSEKDKYEIKAPVAPGKNFIIEIRPVGEIRKAYEDIRKAGETCPSPCGELVKDEKLLDKQFKILEESTNCPYSETFKKEIVKDFILYQGGLGEIQGVSGIYNKNLGVCGMKLIGYSGYDVWLGNYYYQAVFLKGNKVIHLDISLFPVGVFSEVDNLWKSFGFDFSSGCDAECTKKEENYYDNLQLKNSNLAQEIAKRYDIMVKSFKLID